MLLYYPISDLSPPPKISLNSDHNSLLYHCVHQFVIHGQPILACSFVIYIQQCYSYHFADVITSNHIFPGLTVPPSWHPPLSWSSRFSVMSLGIDQYKKQLRNTIELESNITSFSHQNTFQVMYGEKSWIRVCHGTVSFATLVVDVSSNFHFAFLSLALCAIVTVG